jgi:hypothetical protein
MSAAIPFDQIRDVSLAQAGSLLRGWFPNGRVIGREFKVGNIAGDPGESLSINLDTGKWADFAAGISGFDLIDVRAAMKHSADRTAAAREIGPMLGIAMNGHDASAKAPGSQQKRSKTTDVWQPIVPPPAGAGKPAKSEFDGYDQVYDYLDEACTLLFYIRRREERNGEKKLFHPLVYGTLNGQRGWHNRHTDAPRHLYGLDRLKSAPDATVIVCEGEKAAIAAQHMFPDYVCVTWPGGAKAVGHADLSPLRDRKVIIWPDNDDDGHRAASDLRHALPQAGILQVLDLPESHDAADVSPEDPEAWLAERLADERRTEGFGPDFGETLPFTLFSDIDAVLDANDFVEDLLIVSSFVVVYGEPGSGKTFWVLDLTLHVAAGGRWRDREVDQGAVIWLALEGGPGVRNRIAAARDKLGMPSETPLILVQCPVDLCTTDADVWRVIATIKTVEHRAGMPVRLVVVDTLARALAGGNENGPEDMGALVRHSDIIRDQTGACILYIHHCGKDAAKGARGHSSLKAATDTEIEVTCGEKGQHVTRVTRQRDLPSAGRFGFTLKQVELGTNKRGKPVTSCIVEHIEVPVVAARDSDLTDNEKIAMRCLNQAMKADGIMATVFDGGVAGLVVREADWRGWFYRDGKPGENQETKQKAFKRVVTSLLAKGCIGARDDFVWPRGGGRP